LRKGEWSPEGRQSRNDGHNSGWRGRSGNSAQTFRRGRALAFLDRLNVMRATLAAQLNEPEFEPIRPVICGELKAVDNIIQAFVHTFELGEPQRDVPNEEDE